MLLKSYTFSSTYHFSEFKETQFGMYAGDVKHRMLLLQGQIGWLI